MAEKVWLVVRVGVYDQGVAYVATSMQDAQRFTDDYAPDDDGYHKWEIREAEVGVPLDEYDPDDVWSMGYNTSRRR